MLVNCTSQDFQDDCSKELQRLLAQLPAGTVWRDVVDPHGHCLCCGVGHSRDGIDPVLHLLDFREKCVLDLGCNTGYNAFLALQGGARHVFGVDTDALLIRGGRLLAKMHGYTCADFIEASYSDVSQVSELAAGKGLVIDMVLLVDYIGKNLLRKGRLDTLLDSLRQYDCQEIALTVRPLYRTLKHFGMSGEEFSAICHTSRVRGGQYHSALDVVDKMGPDWELLSPVNPSEYDESTGKILLHFRRR